MLWDCIYAIALLTYTLPAELPAPRLWGRNGAAPLLLFSFAEKDLLTFYSRALKHRRDRDPSSFLHPIGAQAEARKRLKAFSTSICSTAQLRCRLHQRLCPKRRLISWVGHWMSTLQARIKYEMKTSCLQSTQLNATGVTS